jgi:YebC/PmpR family DNA-binding regulatory protein
MSGHSKWSTIKRKKGAVDAKRGKIFTKLIKEIVVAVKSGGPEPEANPRLRTAILNAKSNSMPKDNITRAIKKAAGEDGGADYMEIVYEGYGPNGVAFYVEALTDNKNRAVGDIRHAFSKNGGNLGVNGSIAWMFERKGTLQFDKENFKEDALMEHVFESGAEDMTDEGTMFQVVCDASEFENICKYFDDKKIEYDNASIAMIPENFVEINDVETAEKLLKLFDALEDLDDVQNLYANFNINPEIEDQIDL